MSGMDTDYALASLTGFTGKIVILQSIALHPSPVLNDSGGLKRGMPTVL